jgi:hypothetical protein
VLTQVIIEARDLDTDARDESLSIPVEPPQTEAEQRNQLRNLVAEHYPTARIRSFADGAATFLDRQQLIVASYRPRLKARRASTASLQGQDELFAA